MGSTFRVGDVLMVAPVSLESLVRGDVIAFRVCVAGDHERMIVHRVSRVLEDGVVTRGDDRCSHDTELIREASLVGRVEFVRRGDRLHPVRGGYVGNIWALGCRLKRFAFHIARLLGRRMYGKLRERDLIRRVWRPRIERICLDTESGLLVKYVSREKTVAYWWPEKRVFLCRKPYDLLLQSPLSRVETESMVSR